MLLIMMGSHCNGKGNQKYILSYQRHSSVCHFFIIQASLTPCLANRSGSITTQSLEPSSPGGALFVIFRSGGPLSFFCSSCTLSWSSIVFWHCYLLLVLGSLPSTTATGTSQLSHAFSSAGVFSIAHVVEKLQNLSATVGSFVVGSCISYGLVPIVMLFFSVGAPFRNLA
jgi:hypothetical protein